MDQSLNTLLKLGKYAIVGDAHDLAGRPGTYRVTICNRGPWIRVKLFDTQRDLVGFFVKFKYLDLGFFTNLEKFGGMRHPAPGEIGYMAQTVQSTQIYKNPIIRDVGDHAFNHGAFLKSGPHLLAQLVTLFFQNRTAGYNHIVPFAVIFQDLKVE